MSTTLERHWIGNDLECVVIRTDMGHRCGYVCVPSGHPWEGIAYNEAAPTIPRKLADDTPVDDVGILAVFSYGLSSDEQRSEYDRQPVFQVAVHGGLTFSGPLRSQPGLEGWWFGFDCAHADDSPDDWTEERVAEECERLAKQINELALTDV